LSHQDGHPATNRLSYGTANLKTSFHFISFQYMSPFEAGLASISLKLLIYVTETCNTDIRISFQILGGTVGKVD
jgi:hypothetical protein